MAKESKSNLDDVIKRLRDEGNLVRNSGSNSIKSIKAELNVQTELQSKLLSSFENYFAKMSAHFAWVQDRAAKLDADRMQELAQLRSKVDPTVEKKEDDSKPEKQFNFFGAGLLGGLVGALGTVIAGALGGVAAAYGALSFPQMKNVIKGTDKLIFKPIRNVLTWVGKFPERIGKMITGWWDKSLPKIEKIFGMENPEGVRGRSLSDRIKLWKLQFTQGLNKLWLKIVAKTAFIPKAVKAIKNLIPGLDAADETAKVGFASGVWKAVSESKLGSIIGGVFSKVSKWAGRFAWIFSLWDGVKEALDAKDKSVAEGDSTTETSIKFVTGFLGGFTGSFIGGFADLIKDGIVWVLKQVFPSDWIDEKTGKFKKGTLMGTFEDFSFATTIKDGWRMLGDSFMDIVDDIIAFATKFKIESGLASDAETLKYGAMTSTASSEDDASIIAAAARKFGPDMSKVTDEQLKELASSETWTGIGEGQALLALARQRQRDMDRVTQLEKPKMTMQQALTAQLAEARRDYETAMMHIQATKNAGVAPSQTYVDMANKSSNTITSTSTVLHSLTTAQLASTTGF